MKNFVLVTLILVSMLLVGCSDKNNSEKAIGYSKPTSVDKIIYATPDRSCTCVVDVNDIDTVIDISENRYVMMYNVLVSTGRILLIIEDTTVACYYSDKYRGFVPVIFLEGKFKGRRAYVLENRLQ